MGQRLVPGGREVVAPGPVNDPGARLPRDRRPSSPCPPPAAHRPTAGPTPGRPPGARLRLERSGRGRFARPAAVRQACSPALEQRAGILEVRCHSRLQHIVGRRRCSRVFIGNGSDRGLQPRKDPGFGVPTHHARDPRGWLVSGRSSGPNWTIHNSTPAATSPRSGVLRTNSSTSTKPGGRPQDSRDARLWRKAMAPAREQ
jgi:hypothetical protein